MAANATRMRGFGSWLALAAGLIAAAAAVPIISVLSSLAAPAGEVWRHLAETVLPRYAANTALIMLLTGILSTGVGVGAAWLVTATEFPGRRILAVALALPLAGPAYIAAYAYGDFLGFSGPVQSALRDWFGWTAGDYWFPQIRSLPGAALVFALTLYPYTYLLARASFESQSAALFGAARSLGAPPSRAFWSVALPAARPAIAGGLALVLMETIADYGVVDYFGAPTFTAGIFRTWFGLGALAQATQLAAWLFLVAMLLVILERGARRGSTAAPTAPAAAMRRMRLGPFSSAAAIAACAAAPLLGFFGPAAILAARLSDRAPGARADFLEAAANSLSVAAMAAAIAIVAALLLAYYRRQSRSAGARGLIGFATLGYALPGAMLAIGLLGPLTAADRSLNRLAQWLFGATPGLILTGGAAALILAYVIRFLTVGYNAADSGLARIHVNLDGAARSLGSGPFGVIARVHAPLARGAIFAGAVAVFIDVMKELPATLILRPFNFETLATRIYRLAADERLAEAAPAALLLMALGLLPILLLNRLTTAQR